MNRRQVAEIVTGVMHTAQRRFDNFDPERSASVVTRAVIELRAALPDAVKTVDAMAAELAAVRCPKGNATPLRLAFGKACDALIDKLAPDTGAEPDEAAAAADDEGRK